VADERSQGGHLGACEAQGRAVGDVRDVVPAGSQHPVDVGGELEGGQVARRAGAGEHVGDDDVGGGVA
jgi:hypothetical protein